MQTEEYERLHQRLEAAVRRACPAWLQNSRDDLVQTGMMAVLRIADRREEDPHFSASYLGKVAHSAVVDEIRRLRRRREVALDAMPEPRVPTQPAHANPDRAYLGRQITGAIRSCLERLNRPRRLAVTLHLLGYGRPQIARRMGWNHRRAGNLVFRGIQNLRDCLRTLEVTP